MNRKELKELILKEKNWWIADLLKFINRNISNKAMFQFRTALTNYGDYPDNSQCLSSVLVMFVYDIWDIEE